MEVLIAVSFYQRSEARHRVYLERVKRQDRKEEEEEAQSRRVDVLKYGCRTTAKQKRMTPHRLR